MRSSVRRHSLRLRAACVASLLLALGPSLVEAQAPGTTTAETGTPPRRAFKEFTIDPGRGSINQVLPFDEPFFLTGSAPARTERIDLSLVEVRGDFIVRPKENSPGEFECIRLRKRKREPDPGTTCSWQPVSAWETNPLDTSATPAFYLKVTPLNAARYYAFRLRIRRGLTDEQLATFRGAAEEVFWNALSGKDSLDVSEQEFRDMQKTLRLLLEMLAVKQEITFTGVGFLATDFNSLSDQQKSFFRQQTGAVLQAKADQDDALRDRARHAQTLGKSLETILGDTSLEKMAIEIVRSGPDTIRTAFADELTLARLGSDGALSLARGIDTGSTSSVDRLGDPDDLSSEAVQTVRNNYQGTRRRLASLRELVEDVVDGDITIDGLEQTDLESLRALVTPDGPFAKALGLLSALSADLGFLDQSLKQRQAALSVLASSVRGEAREIVRVIDGTTVDSFQTRSQWYFGMDLGLAAAPELEEVLQYTAVNIYLRPVNKQAPLRLRDSFGRRFAFTVGITAGSIEEALSGRQDLFSSSNTNLLVGMGLRVIDSVRLGLGAVVFKEDDPNPLNQETSLTSTPYVSFSVDWDVRCQFVRFGLFNDPTCKKS